MSIGGLQKVSLIDFPAHIAAVVFTKGCNFVCPFCFNRSLVLGTVPTISQRTVLTFLQQRQKLLDGVVITGGEPLLHDDLKMFLLAIKKMGYPIKLDTNGSLPDRLKKVLKKSLVDYLALDFKAPLDGRWNEAVGRSDFDFQIWQQSLKLLLDSGIPFELRTTVVPGIHDQTVLREMGQQLAKLIGVNQVNRVNRASGSSEVTRVLKPTWYWQNFQPGHCLDPQFDNHKPYSAAVLDDFLKTVKRCYSQIELRKY
ncbi:anaerobic ribonucleoside-triphosphate reductase activating protein [Candidatus Shapirobacteria bacterium CG10_big_fil_rev_8_21_14_0_10_48_15]|uniref:Anaerobic ribonucleoside-triphosphate reductase activating protein n=2 Tax=Candidatus Shapironibacteriota TaxID=1752721 RepID=A0A2M8L7M3_9BACT|nr:MAG: anaerobic ribonucleoside-triphosphate reductase activating protein [Candidatus Shapirobacteria bacterium CG10_big_fil_rev_8_21_14_0_10_48_15]